MTNYNDGNWHGWIKGDLPVNPHTIVEVLHAKNGILFERKAGITAWNDANLIAFRVIKEHKEPREWSVVVDKYGDIIGCTNRELTSELGFALSGYSLVKVREVIE